MTERRRVAITGIGAVTPIGISRDGLWDGVRECRSAVRTVTRFDASLFRSKNAAEIEFQATDFIEARRARKLDRFNHFTIATARLAIGSRIVKVVPRPTSLSTSTTPPCRSMMPYTTSATRFAMSVRPATITRLPMMSG